MMIFMFIPNLGKVSVENVSSHWSFESGDFSTFGIDECNLAAPFRFGEWWFRCGLWPNVVLGTVLLGF